MTARLLVVTGTGTEIGKTHTSEALLHVARRGRRAVGIKPVESGLASGEVMDAERLSRASTFHVQHPAYRFAPPISPHLAARARGVVIDLAAICRTVADVRAQADVVLVELAGGLFSPLGDAVTNADLALMLAPDVLLLVAPDRLGVLHDAGATRRAAAAMGLRLPTLALVAPAVSDASTGTNAPELRRDFATVVTVPRAPLAALAEDPSIATLAAVLLGEG